MSDSPEVKRSLQTSHRYESIYNDHPDKSGAYSDAVIEAVTSIDSVMVMTDINLEDERSKSQLSHRLYEYFRGGLHTYTLDYNYTNRLLSVKVYEDQDEPQLVYEGYSFEDAKKALNEFSYGSIAA